MPQAVLLLSPEALASAYGEPVFSRLRNRVQRLGVISPAEHWRREADVLREAEVIFSGWGAPRMDDEFLRHAPKLRAVFYAGGSVRYFVTEALWRRGVRLTTAQAINAIPVAEYAASALLLGLKRFWHYARVTRESRDFPSLRPMAGAYGSTVGLVSYGAIARLTRERLRTFAVDVLVYDPFLDAEEARREGVRKVGLDELFASADAVSVHTPYLGETTRLIRGQHLARMRTGAIFLNTARGEVVDEPEMIDVLRRRPDLQAVLDVTAPEPPAPDSPLYTLPNVVLTPHIAGSVGRECLRMGEAMIEEFERFLAGQPLRWEITAARAERIA
ncbi:MAG TPA: hydroxyacid dehydrogenase [Opitutaceae bacterium]|nr:hydroxyacid dehydrogenase [Opitutaceae bacterium]